MAKIYETQADIDRTQLQQEVMKSKTSRDYFIGFSLMGLVVNMADLTIRDLHKTLESVGHSVETRTSKGIRVFGQWFEVAFTAVAAGAAIMYEVCKRRAEKKLDALGPQEVIVPMNSQTDVALDSRTILRAMPQNFMDKIRAEREAGQTSPVPVGAAR